VKISDLTPDELQERFARSDLRARIGPFVFRLHTPIRSFATDFTAVYGDFPLCAENEISDFRIRVMPAVRRWPWQEAQALFGADAVSPFLTFPRRLALPFAEWGLNWCICNHAHQFLIFHSAVVEKAGRAAILAGPPGSGKSTLCAALLGRGWRLLSDELALLDPARGCLLPIPRPVALKGASIELIERLSPQLQICRVFAPTPKGTLAHLLPPIEAVERQAEPALPGWVLFPTHAENADTRLVPLGKAAGFVRLERNCFNYEVLGRPAFDALSDMIEASECYELPFAHAMSAAELIDGLAELQPVAGVPLDAA
jgi:HprK-related kinase A